MNLTKLRKFYFNVLPSVFFASGALFLLLAFAPLLLSEAWYFFKQIKKQQYIVSTDPTAEEVSIFGKLLGSKPVLIKPANTDFSIVIEKLDVSSPVVADVSVFDPAAYKEALKSGVAHSAGSSYPSSNAGNVYIFAHASLNFWELGKYATVFNLLRKLEPGDPIHIFYQNKLFLYKVVGVQTHNGWDTRPLNRATIEPILTLQTCDPPGTTLNRLVVTAKLSEERAL